jgi:adenylylsulfate kinase
MIIQIIGLPGSGKTTLALELADRTNAIHLNADEVRAELNKDLDFSPESRIEQARRMGALARLLSRQGFVVVVDFICPTHQTREAFGKPNLLVVMKRTPVREFADTTAMWEEPLESDITFGDEVELEEKIQAVLAKTGLPDWKAPTTLQLGRYQPWHEGHQALYEKAKERTPQVLVAVRHTQGTSEKDPFSYQQVSDQIKSSVNGAFVLKVPNITNIVYGRDVGYKIEQVDLGADIHAISATQKRKEMGL